MTVCFHDTASSFLTDAETVLEAHEDTASLMLGVCRSVSAGRVYGDQPPLFATIRNEKGCLALAVRTPPHRLILFAEDDGLGALEELAEALHGQRHLLPGCHGVSTVSAAFSRAWCQRTGQVPEVAMRQKVFRLDAVTPPRHAPGRLREATEADLTWVLSCARAFQHEAVPHDPPRDSRPTIDWMMSRNCLWIWEDAKPVSLCGAPRATKQGIAIGLVYTPPAHRGKGYASNCVAAASQRLLDKGYDFCTLFTDLSNPTSNRIYGAVGYRPLAEFRAIDFRDGPA